LLAARCIRHEMGMGFTLDNLRSVIGVAFVFGLA
jgi:hypothetical protein